jgi:aryl-alcohol dehydrogenase-like predicted oxidoreductase
VGPPGSRFGRCDRTRPDLGLNWIDTAAIYDLGHSEEVVARALKHSPHKPYVFTKSSMRWDRDRKIYRSLKASSVREEVEASLRRLKLDVIDLYQIHWPDPEAEIEEGWETMAHLKAGGQGPLYRRLQLQRRADGARREDRPDYLPAAALFDHPS